MAKKISTYIYERRKLFLIVSSVLLALSLLFAWWHFIFANPERVFSDMLSNNLQTTGIVRSVSQDDPSGSIDQQIYLSFRNGPKVQTLTTLKQNTPEGGSSQVVTENIGTTKADFIRYRELSVEGPEGPSDTSAAVGQWAQRGSSDEPAGQASFLSEGLFGIVAFGDFDNKTRERLTSQISESAIYSYSSLNRQFEGGRYIYDYQVKVVPSSLVSFLGEYAKSMGVRVGNELNPENYVNAPPIEANFKVDVLTRQLRSIEYGESGRTERFSSWGIKRPIDLPTQTITIDELTKRLQSIE